MPQATAFTLIELLAVISIIGILAAVSVPVLKNFGKSDVTVSASRQLFNDIGYARQLAMSDRTTVYMVFLQTNFWTSSGNDIFNPSSDLTSAQLTAATNLLDKQLVGYTYIAYGALGDQPGRHAWHYLAPWQSLPDGAFIPLWKFYNGTPSQTFTFYDPANNSINFSINPFSYTNTFPFPTQDSTNIAAGYAPLLPYIAFNYLGQLCNYSGQLLTAADDQGQDFDQDYVGGGVDIPLAQGAVIPYVNQTTHMLEPTTATGAMAPPQVVENPPGNSTNIDYNVIHIDPLTGRPTLEFHKMQ